MFEEINENLKMCKENVILKEILEKKVVTLEMTLESKELELTKLKKSLEKEYKDIKKLEGISINNIFATLAGNKEDKLYKEQQEYIQVQLKHEECDWTVSGYKDDLIDMRVRILDLAKYEEEYKRLISQKLEIIKSIEVTDNFKNELEKEENNRNLKIKEEIEIKEAIKASKECLDIIKTATESLSSAKKWGTFDLIGGSSIISSMVKHQRIEAAKMQLNNLGYSIGKLKKELGDINMFFMFDGLNFDNLTYAFDVFFDNIFTDMSVQSKINDALAKIKNLDYKVTNLLDELDKTEKQINEEIIIINRRIDELIQQAD